MIDDRTMGPNPPHPTQILINSAHVVSALTWCGLDDVPDDAYECDYDDVYDAVLMAINICDGRVNPKDSKEEEPRTIHEWIEDPLVPWPNLGDRFTAGNGDIWVFRGLNEDGGFVFHPVAEPDMQSSWVLTNDQFVAAVIAGELSPVVEEEA